MTLKSYIETLASDAPAPGGGSASALCGAQGAALFTMVAQLTVSKEKYAESVPLCQGVICEGQKLQAKFLDLVERDTEAFLLISNAYKMPRETDEQKSARSRAIAAGTLVSTEVPLETMRCALRGLEQAEKLIGHSNPNAASDLGVSVLNLLACVRGAYLNVRINLDGIKDEQRRIQFESDAQAVLAQAEQLAASAYEGIAGTI